MSIGSIRLCCGVVTRTSIVGLILASVGMLGCSPSPTSAVIRGTVSVGGRPLPGGVIGFHSTSDAARWSAGQIGADGVYLVPDAPLGPCMVTIDTTMLKDRPRISDAGETSGPTPGGLPGGSGLMLQEPHYVPIHEQFMRSDKSPLSATVVVGENSFDFTVE